MRISPNTFNRPAPVAWDLTTRPVRFGARKGTAAFTREEAQRLADAIIRHDPLKHHDEEDKSPGSREELSQAIYKGIQQPYKGQEYRYGMVYPNGQIKTSDPIFRKIAVHLLNTMPSGAMPKEGLVLVVRERGHETFDAVEGFLKEKLVPHFQVSGRVPTVDKAGKASDVEVLETVAWPFFHQVISGKPLLQGYKPLVHSLEQLPMFQLRAGAAPQLESALQEAFRPLKGRLTSLEAATMQYSDQVELKEVVISLLAGSSVGGVGEYAIHHALPEGGMLAGALRTGTLVLVDFIVGVCGEMGVLMSDMEANGLELSIKELYGDKKDGKPKRWWNILANPFGFDGRAGIFAKRAAVAATKGAALGGVLSAPAGFGLSMPGLGVGSRAAIGSVSTMGTATSLPFNIRATLPQMYLATMSLIHQGKIAVPDDIKANEKALKKYALHIAEQDMLSRLGFSASLKAYAMTPLSGAMLLSEAIGVPREMAQTLYMSISPALDNLFRLVMTVGRMKWGNPHNISKVEHMVLDAADRPFDAKESLRLERLFADRAARSLSWLFTRLPKPVVLPNVTLVGFQPKSQPNPAEETTLLPSPDEEESA